MSASGSVAGAARPAERVGRRGAVARAVRGGGGLLLAAPLWAWWASDEGGFAPPVWLAGLCLLALVLVVAAAGDLMRRPSAPAVAALGAVAALAALTALSTAWAADKGSAWLEAQRAALVLVAFATPLLWPPGRPALRLALALWPACALTALAVGLHAARQEADALVDGRLSAPTGYPNATAALLVMGALPAIVMAARAQTPRVLRVLALAAAGVLACGALTTQSRGIVAVAVLAVAVLALLGPDRLRLLAAAGAVGAATALAHTPLLRLRTADLHGASAAGVDRAARAMVVVALALGGAAWAWATLDRAWRVRHPAPRARRRRAGMRIALVAVLVAALTGAAFAGTGGRPAHWAGAKLDDFRTPDYHSVEMGGTRFGGGLGSNRYDYWRVSVEVARERPWSGAGAGSFAESYLLERRSPAAPHYAHSIWFGTVAELGVGGLVLALGAVAAGALAVRRVRRGAQRGDAGLRLAALAPLIVLLIDASGDWTFAYPVLAVPAVALAAAALAPWGTRTPAHTRRLPRPAAWAIALAAVAVAVAGLPILTAERLTTRAQATFHSRPDAALADLQRAAEVTPGNPRPLLVKGIVALELRRPAVARVAFAAASRRDPHAWFPLFEQALLDARRAPVRARELLRAARARNPTDAQMARTQRALARGRFPDPLSAQRAALEGPA